MKKKYNIEGMSCMHCVGAVEKALNAVEGIKAKVTLEPPVAEIEFDGDALPLVELQKIVGEHYKFSIE